MKIIFRLLLLFPFCFLVAQDCEDDVTGAWLAFGGCDAVINTFGVSCDTYFSGSLVSEECPLSCDDCPDEGAVTGCDFPDMSLSVLPNGDVLYNTSEAIGGFQFNIEGAIANGASGGDAGSAGFNMSTNPSSGMVLGFSLTGSTISAGCGTLVELDLEGIPTGMSGIIISDGNAQPLEFNYVAPPITNGCQLPALNLLVTSSGDVLYNTSEAIGGFQFNIEGAIVNDASGGAAATAGFQIMTNAGSGLVMAFSLTGSTIPVGCGTLVEVDLDGIPTGMSGIIISDGDAQPIDFSYYDDSPGVAGCMDGSACNYNANATEDDGSCTYAEENYDCDGNCVVEIDCADICGGDTIVDECGECDGDGIDEGACDCEGNVLDCTDICGGSAELDECGECGGDGIDEGACDCDGNVNDCADICGGSAELDECGECGGDGIDEGACDCDGNVNDCAGECGGSAELDECGVCGGDGSSCDEEISYSLPLHQYNNLISFYVLPDDDGIDVVLASIESNVTVIMGEGTSAQNTSGGWIGSLINLDISSGYWIGMANADTLHGSGSSFDPNRVYDLHVGANLVSFPYPGSVGISMGLPDDIEDNIQAIIGEGQSAVNSENGWMGSLNNFEGLNGYWIFTDSEISFSYDLDSETLSRISNLHETAKKPQALEFIQSSQQAFYFIDEVTLKNERLESGDWLVSYCSNIITGSRQYLGETIDVPVMGYDGHPSTEGYCQGGDTPHFKLYKTGQGNIIDLQTSAPQWQSNGIFFLSDVKETSSIPSNFVLFTSYPNPFNPITNISFALPEGSWVKVIIHDIAGRELDVLLNRDMQAGHHFIQWNAEQQASGVYFVRMEADGVRKMQKLLLLK